MNYNHLFYFWRVAKDGSISKASEQLRVGQSSISLQLKQLEDYFGHKLFERRNRKLILTEQGRTVLQYAENIFKLGFELQHTIARGKKSLSGAHIQIGAIDSIPKHFVSKIAHQAQLLSKGRVTILEGSSDSLLRELAAHHIDILISDSPHSMTTDLALYSKRIARLPVSFYGSKRFAHIKNNFPNSLDQTPVILPTYHSRLRHEVEHWFKTNSCSPLIVAETQDTMVQKLLGEQALGVFPIAEPAVSQMLKSKIITRIGRLEGVYEDVWLISASRKIENPVAMTLLQAVGSKSSIF
jgi:LysR family transcriptional activator of nhaA